MPVRANEPRKLDEWMVDVEQRLRQLEARGVSAGEGLEKDHGTETVAAKFSADAGNIAVAGTDAGIYATVVTAPSSCIAVAGDGTGGNAVTAAPILSPDVGNTIECRLNGLYVNAAPAFAPVYAEVTSDVNVSNGSTVQFVAAPAVTVDGATRIRVTICWGAIFSGAEGDRMDMLIREGASTVNAATISHDITSTNSITSGGCYASEFTPSSGAHTYNFAGFARTGSPTLRASSTLVGSIRVEDATW